MADTPKISPPVPVLTAFEQALVEPIRYDRHSLACGIVHLGMGNFHRAHQASILHEVMQARPDAWMIQGVGMLPGDKPLIKAMQKQNNLYTLTECAADQPPRLRVIGTIANTMLAPEEPTAVINAMASPATKIISLTITEAGYYHTSSGQLDTSHPKIQADLCPEALPQTGLGYLYAGLQARMRASKSPVTVVSCDNLLGNGDLTRRLLLQFARLKNPETAEWIEDEKNVGFPNSMVDRITPATSPATRTLVRDSFGKVDLCPVMSEDFRQWVIEDKFTNGRPELEKVDGVLVVDDVTPYEQLKTRLLNGSHSAMAYVSYLMGHRRVDEAIQNPLIHGFIRRYMDYEVTPTLPKVKGIDIEEYKATLLKRFANPAIADQVERLAKDGSAKIAIYIVPALRKRLEMGGSIRHMAFALATWARYLEGHDENGGTIVIDDGIWDRLKRPLRTASDLIAIEEIFGPELSHNPYLIEEVDRALSAIATHGTENALRQLLAPK